MANGCEDLYLIRAFIRGARLAGESSLPPKTIVQVLESLILQNFQTTISNGRVLIETQEAGGSVRFEVPANLSSSQIITIAEKALEWLLAQPDPNNPDLSLLTPVKRLSVSFKGVSL